MYAGKVSHTHMLRASGEIPMKRSTKGPFSDSPWAHVEKTDTSFWGQTTCSKRNFVLAKILRGLQDPWIKISHVLSDGFHLSLLIST